jgi:hypothetical protein
MRKKITRGQGNNHRGNRTLRTLNACESILSIQDEHHLQPNDIIQEANQREEGSAHYKGNREYTPKLHIAHPPLGIQDKIHYY